MLDRITPSVQTVTQDVDVFVSGLEARRITGYSWGRLMRLGAIGAVGIELRPGTPVRYRLADLMRLGVTQAVGA